MGAVKDAYQRVLDDLIATGRAERAEDATYPTDAELTDMARTAAARIGAGPLFTDVDSLTLVDLRDAYNDGREPELLDFNQVVAALAAHGVEAHVEDTSGATATLFAGPWHLPNADGVIRRAVSLGPGHYAPDDSPVGYTDQLSYGPATATDDGENVEDHARPSEVARGIADMLAQIFPG